ncbi:MAG: (2Fe-2S)-binding protein, partial [Rhodobacteraceae bacterium]|nr:(2Fe-2S)-binding protein [Paracoccaceae bacterium]
EPDPLQQAFIETGGAQCGYCTPGMITAARALLNENPNPTLDEIKKGPSGHPCRCTGYTRTFEAVSLAAQEIQNAGKTA